MIIDVLILYEHVARELESALLLEEALKHAGLSVQVMMVHWNDGIIHLKYKPKIIITPWCYSNFEVDELCKQWKGGYEKNSFKIVNLHCEQIANNNGAGYLLPKERAINTYHFVWGAYFKNVLLKAGVDEKLIYLTGSPRLDFFRPKYKNLNSAKEELAKRFNLNPNKKWILLIGNFSAKNATEEEIERNEKKGYACLRKQVEFTRKTYYELLNWYDYICSLDNLKEEFEFIYRPHPNETITDQLVELSKKHENLHIIKDLSIKDWIVNSNIAFGWCSTSSVEVITAGVPIFNLRPFEMTEDMRMPLVDEIETLVTKEEFADVISKTKDGLLNNTNAEFKKNISYYYEDTGSATELERDYIIDILNSNGYLFESHYDLLSGVTKTFRFIIKRIMIALGLKSTSITEIMINDVRESKNIGEYRDRIRKANIL